MITSQISLFDQPIDEIPTVLPYGGTSGWSGSSSSKDRAERTDKTGTTSSRQRVTLQALDIAGGDGLTWYEVGSVLNTHHGAASGVLSVLHKAGVICRVSRRRGRSQVYCLPQHVKADDTIEPYQSNRSTRQLLDILIEIAQDLDSGQVTTARHRIGATINHLTNQQ